MGTLLLRKTSFILLSLLLQSILQAQGWTIQNVGTTLDLNGLYQGTYPNPQIIFCNQGLILRSTDNGITWNQILTPTSQNLNDGFNNLAVGNNGVILRSTNQGINWRQVNSNTNNNLNSISINVAVGANGTILRGYSNGTNWVQETSPTTATLNDNISGLIVGANGTILHYNSQNQWEIVNSGTTNDLLSVNGNPPNLITGRNGTILESTDGGSSWQPIVSGTTADIYSIVLYWTNYGYSVMYASGTGGLVRKSTDGGITWTTMTTGVNAILKRITVFYPIFNYTERRITAFGTGGTMINNSSEYLWLNPDTLNANSIRTPVWSGGSFNGYNGFEWPAGSNLHARYESGIFLGAKVGTDTLVAIGYYGGEFAPGKTVNEQPVGYFDPAYRIYKLRYQVNDSNRQQWPNALLGNSDQGAPVCFDTNTQSWKPFDLGHQTIFHSYTDSYADLHRGYGGQTAPLKADVREVDFAINSWNGIGRSTFHQYTIINKSLTTWNSFYIGFYFDDDLGDAEDDLIGVDSVLGMAYTYNGDNYDEFYGANPPAVGVVALRGPIVFTGNNSDTASLCNCRERLRLPRYREVKFNVMRWLAKAGPFEWTEPRNYSQAYLALKGLLNNAQPIMHPSGYMTTFSHTGDPVTNTGWLLTNMADHRLMISVGPLTMNPGDTQVVVIAQVIARGTSNLNSITALRQTAAEAINYYNSCYDPFPIGIEPVSSQIPERFILYQNYPNPFNAATTIKYDIPKDGSVLLKVYDILGREVYSINELKKAGSYKFQFDGENLASGLYYYRIESGDFVETKKMVLIK